MNQPQDENFQVVFPAEIEKADDGNYKIFGLASTPNKDLQGESINIEGLDLTPVDQGKGKLNWEHQGNDPENIVGVIDSYSKEPKKGLYISGRLFKNHQKAQAIQEIMSSLGEGDRGRVGLSVEGSIQERDKRNPKKIKKAKIKDCAITMNPVNTDTYADIVKSLSAPETEIDFQSEQTKKSYSADEVLQLLEKALGVGAGYAESTPSQLSGGEALAQEDLDDDSKDQSYSDAKSSKKKSHSNSKGTKKEDEKKSKKEVYKSRMLEVLDKLSELYPNASREELWESFKTRLHTKYPDLEQIKQKFE